MISSFKKLTLLGSIPAIFSLVLPFLHLKENRISDGLGFSLLQIPLPFLTIPILITILIILGMVFLPREIIKNVYLFVCSFLLILLLLILIAISGEAVGIGQFAYGRISLSGGFWILFSTALFLFYGSLKSISSKSSIKYLLSLSPFIIITLIAVTIGFESLAIVKEFDNESRRFFTEMVNHFSIAIRATIFAIVLGLPLGIWATRNKKAGSLILAFVNGAQAVPSLALFGLLIAPLSLLSRTYPILREMGVSGIGVTPALIALTLYALLPIVKNTISALQSINRDTIESGLGMGMSKKDLFFKVELPVSLPIIFTGIRISLVQTFGNTTVAALIGAGGLGYFIFRGLEQASPDLIVMGVIPIIFLVTILDKSLTQLILVATPKGLRRSGALQ